MTARTKRNKNAAPLGRCGSDRGNARQPGGRLLRARRAALRSEPDAAGEIFHPSPKLQALEAGNLWAPGPRSAPAVLPPRSVHPTDSRRPDLTAWDTG
jgi:hypothetical protein